MPGRSSLFDSAVRYFMKSSELTPLFAPCLQINQMYLDDAISPSKAAVRVVSAEISGNSPWKISGHFRKFIPIFPEISAGTY